VPMTDFKPPALVLAGGKSLRMGAAKAWLPFGSGTLLSHILQRLEPQVSEISLNVSAGVPVPEGLRTVSDTLPGQPGPLAGVLAGLRDLAVRGAGFSHLLTVPSDAPFLPADLAQRLAAACEDDGVAIAASLERTHPVFALWPLGLADDLEEWLSDPEHRRLSDFLARHRVARVDWPAEQTEMGLLDPFMNVNTPAELEEARRFLEVMP
jgi:molybdopterin-guanine dinucleotide biosynthesis protein A